MRLVGWQMRSLERQKKWRTNDTANDAMLEVLKSQLNIETEKGAGKVSKLLDKLNSGIADDLHWKAIEEWENERGILGIYASDNTPLAQENVSVYLMIGDNITPLAIFPRQSLKHEQGDIEAIATFAGAISEGAKYKFAK